MYSYKVVLSQVWTLKISLKGGAVWISDRQELNQ